MTSSPQLVALDAVTPQPWRNGGGQTRVLLTWPALDADGGGNQGGEDCKLRISVATIDRDGPFSAFPSLQRWFAVLDGAGVELDFGPARQTLLAGDNPFSFQGKDAPGCRLIDGSTRDLNLMSQGGTSRMERVQMGKPWLAAGGFAALYTVAPGIWSDDAGNSLVLPAHSLCWDAAPAVSMHWHFTPADASAPLAGFWLHFTATTSGGKP